MEKQDKKNNNRNFKGIFAFLLLCCFLAIEGYFLFLEDKVAPTQVIEELSYNDFMSAAQDGNVYQITYSPDNEWMDVILYDEASKQMSADELSSYTFPTENHRKVLYPANVDFRKEMLEMDINLVYEENNSLSMLDLLTVFLNLAFPIPMIFFLYKAMSMQFGGKSPFDEKKTTAETKTKFTDVIGQDEIIDDIKLITKLIKDPNLGVDIGANPPKGILLTGLPGVGKTLIAKAIAGEAGVPLINVNGSDFNEMFVGMGAKRVRELFKKAKEQAPCIIFIDEIDAIGQKRTGRNGNQESDNTLDALLKEMDGFVGREGIFILAATNHPEKLDSALKRAGRFDRQIDVKPPKDWKVRLELLEHYAKNYKMSDNVDLESIAKTMGGFTGADIAMICNESALVALMHEKPCIDHACMEEAIDKIMFHGNRSKREEYAEDKRVVAYHEAGHAVMTYLEHQPISRASIIGTTSGVGGAVFGGDTDSCFVTDKELLGRIRIAYAGRASEEIKFETVTTGASNDITQATQYMISYIEKYGFDKDFGMLDMEVLNERSLLNNESITEKLSEMSKKTYEQTISQLKENYFLVEALATKLLEVETLTGTEILELFRAQKENSKEKQAS